MLGEQVTGLVVRAMLPEISPGSYLAPQVRYGIDLDGNPQCLLHVDSVEKLGIEPLRKSRLGARRVTSADSP